MASGNLITLSEAKTYMGITTDSYDTLITTLIGGVSDFIEKECNREFTLGVRTEYYDGNGTVTLVLRNFPVVSLTYVKVTRYPTAETTTFYESDLTINYSLGIITIPAKVGGVTRPARTYIFDYGHRNIEVKYKAGYSEIPTGLKLICMRLVSLSFTARGNEFLSSIGIGGFSASFERTGIPEDIKRALATYKRNIILGTKGYDLI